MDCEKTGSLIRGLRYEKGMTQKQLADRMNISDRTVSKWERGQGCPDIELLHELSGIFNVNMEKMIEGELNPNDSDGGNMKKTRFYLCPNCGNVIAATSDAEVTCCGRKLKALIAKPEDDEHMLTVEDSDGEYYITFSHPMSKEHYLTFVAEVGYDRMMLVRLYPEQGGEMRMPKLHGGKFYFGCTRDGLFEKRYNKG